NWKRPKFYLLDGPPYVNGVPHVGHAKTTVFKDIWGRFKYMQGFVVWFQPGFDCGGLPIENKVEEKLGIGSKAEIEKVVGLDKFIGECKALAKGNESQWLDFYKEIGAWRGGIDPYLTSENYYLESGWWTVKQWYEKGLLVEGQRPGFWCPKCETVLAGIEVTESYKEVEDPSIVIRFPVKGRKNEWLLVFTTTPWTLPANVAIIVHPDEKYVRAKSGDDTYIIAEKRLQLLEEIGISAKVLEKFLGKKLEGIRYEPALKVPLQEKMQETKGAHQVYLSVPIMLQRVASKVATKKKVSKKSDEFGHIVTMDVGTGLVHTAPGHGDVDNKIGKHYNLPELSPVDEGGRLTEDAGEFQGMFVKDADPLINEKMKVDGTLLWEGRIRHSYPLCWRCKTPLIYRMSRQWFLKMDLLREKILKSNKKVKWLPDFASERYRHIVEEAPDWAVTRQRYWGIALPFGTCAKCGTKKIIGSKDELRKNATTKLPDEFDLHKNFVDNVHLKCSCGGKMTRDPDIMDVWFDSGISPWASLGYPFRNRSLFKKLWMVDLVDESLDQVRAWFNTLMICSYATFGQEPYKTVCLNGWTIDEKGEKMSKSLGNVVYAKDAYQALGADALRLYTATSVAPWETQRFSYLEARETTKALNILWNSYNFYKTYCLPAPKPVRFRTEDHWIISKTNTMITDVTKQLENFEFHLAYRQVLDFILNDLSRWYIKIIRDRVSAQGVNPDSITASYTMRHVLENMAKLMAPVTPFVSEIIWDGTGHDGSIHESEWPLPEKKLINSKLESNMELAKNMLEAINVLRQEEKIKLRWPVDSAQFHPNKGTDLRSALEDLQDIICNLGNVKKAEIVKKRGKKSFQEFSASIGSALHEEALARELIRAVQVQRKKSGLDVRQRISLNLQTDDKTRKILDHFKREIMTGVGASKISFGQLKRKKDELKFDTKTVGIDFEVSKDS
ncbi:MAG: isoleucine--tRNA ligase, partial [Candidatus Aenigmatarchaeota archaeon]